jgi:signal recognition particle subunit SRP54
MFDALARRFDTIFQKLRGKGVLTEADVDAALREVRVALLEADVALPVVKQLIEDIREKSVGQAVLTSVSPGHQVVKIVHDALLGVLGAEAVPLNLRVNPPAVVLLVGLQGSGKTTTAAKLAKHLQTRERKNILLASLDVYRPAAREQLALLASQLDIPILPSTTAGTPVELAKAALTQARNQVTDVLILDTAGRLEIDAEMMAELQAIQAAVPAQEILLVADSMLGQAAVSMAQGFQAQLPLTGLILTRLDSDARAGVALSVRQITGCPIKFLGTGEKLDDLEIFHPDRLAGRILGMGDIVTLVERAADRLQNEEVEEAASRMAAGKFDLNDVLNQLRQVKKMGGIGGMMGLMPGVSKMKKMIENQGPGEAVLKKQEAIILSMTPTERRDPKLLNASRKRRIALGSGSDVSDINRLLKSYQDMADLLKKLRGPGGAKMLSRGGLKNLFGKLD